MMINTIEEAISRLRYIQLDTDFTPQQILHMILAGGSSQKIYNVQSGAFLPAVDFICRGARDLPGYPIPGGLVQEDSKGQPVFTRGTAKFPGNRYENEFLGTLAVAQVNFKSTPITTNHGNQGTLQDMADAANREFTLTSAEPSWSLMLFSDHPGVTAEWHNEQGEMLSVERIVESAIRRPYGIGPCAGTHLLEGVAYATSRFCLSQDVEPAQLTGTWREAYEYLLGATELIHKNQRDDGSVPGSWFKRNKVPLTPREWKEQLKDFVLRKSSPPLALAGTTSHCLDAFSSMSMFLNDDREWIDLACYAVAKTLETDWLALVRDIPALTHGVHALKLLGKL